MGWRVSGREVWRRCRNAQPKRWPSWLDLWFLSAEPSKGLEMLVSVRFSWRILLRIIIFVPDHHLQFWLSFNPCPAEYVDVFDTFTNDCQPFRFSDANYAFIFPNCMGNCVDPDLIASEETPWSYLHCFKDRKNPGSAWVWLSCYPFVNNTLIVHLSWLR